MKTRIALALYVTFLMGCTRTREHIFDGQFMGSDFEVRVVPSGIVTEAVLKGLVADTFSQADAALSLQNPTSELSTFNASDKLIWLPASRALVTVAEQALWIAKLTDGAWDPTAGKLNELYRRAGGKAPGPQTLATAKTKVGYFHLEARQEPLALKKSRRGMVVDFTAFAPGYAVDELAAALRRQGQENFQIRVGGVTRAAGTNARHEAWPYSYQRPATAPNPPAKFATEVIALENRSAAGFAPTDETLVDPRTAKPLVTDLVSVTVLDLSALKAQALAVGLFTVGKTAALELARKKGTAAFFTTQTQDHSIAEATSYFPSPIRSTY
jgi:thiamine biosynthesis lipoprotein